MTSLDTRLWGLISTHDLPDDASGRPFIEQLMAEQRISRDTATVAIAEYRKFIYLCATRPERNIPSKAVDLVWHLHMLHSRDYWDVFCKKLGKAIHHTPGVPGPRQLDDYKATVKTYNALFGTAPRGIWKRTNRPGQFVSLIVPALFMALGATFIARDGVDLFWVLWLAFSLLGFAATLHSLTTKGALTLIFESDDPFADDEAGDCGSGNCSGGCGD